MTDSSDRSTPWTPGIVIGGRYRVESRLGSGGMGEVYRARDELLHRSVALKRLLGRRSNEALRRRALREARRAGRVSDARIVAIHDVIEVGDELIVVMELVDGRTLREALSIPLGLDQFLPLAASFAEALSLAHESGVLHGDLKPENLMLSSRGEVRVLDFGVARQLDVGAGLTAEETTLDTKTGVRAGTPAYMAPEVHLGRESDQRADIFSLGVVFYELLCAARPFRGETLALQIESVLHAAPTPPNRHREDLPEELSDLIVAMLRKDPEQRPRSMAAVLEVLQRLGAESGLVTPARIPSTVSSPAEGARRLPARWLLAALLAGVAVVAAVVIGQSGGVGSSKTAELPEQPYFAVLPPQPQTGGSNRNAFDVGIAAVIHDELAPATADAPFQIARFNDVLQVVDDADLANLRAKWGINLALVTTYRQTGSRHVGEVRLVRAGDGGVLAGAPVEAGLDADRLVAALHAAMAQTLGIDDVATSEMWYAREPGTLAFYLRGVGELWLGARSGVARGVKLDHFRAAEGELSTALRTRLAFPRGHAALAATYYYWGRELQRDAPDQAERRFRQGLREADAAVESDADLAAAHYIRGQLLYRMGEPERSAPSLRRAIDLNPTEHEAVRRYAGVLERTAGAEAAAAFLRDRIQASPHVYRHYLQLGALLSRTGRPVEALDVLSEATRTAPDYYRPCTAAGGVLIGLGRYAEAESYLQRALELYPSYEVYSNLGTSLFFQDKLQAAAVLYRRAIERGHADDRMWRNLGDALHHAGKPAGDAYRKSLELSAPGPDGAEPATATLAQRALLLVRTGREQEGRGALERCATRDEVDPDGLKDLAVTAWELGDEPKAKELLERAVQAGFTTSQLRDSPEFRGLRDEEWFVELVQEVH